VHDGIDLWVEEINEANTQYKVDGEWRNLEKITELITVKN
jgi:acyl-homoserine lactone acylase PvdQ